MNLMGSVKSIIYENSDSTYKVLRVETSKKEITVVGYFPIIDLYGYYTFEGDFIDNDKYGRQFKAIVAIKRIHSDKEGLIKYLASKKFKGIGEKTAEKIVAGLGLEALDIIKRNPEVLIDFGIKRNKALEYQQQLKESEKEEELIVKLYGYELTPVMVNRLIEKYHDNALKIVETNPYQLIDDLDGYGFVKADNLALKLGFKLSDEVRIKAALKYTLNQACIQKGFTFLSQNQFLETSYKLIDKNHDEAVSKEDILKIINELKNEENLVVKNNRYYPLYLYQAEDISYKRLMAIKNYSLELPAEEKINSLIPKVEEKMGFELTELQRLAIKKTVSSKIAIITGGPGTGKTTIVKALLELEAMLKELSLDDERFSSNLLLLAPTGKAAKRLSQSTSLPARTIHSALGYNETGYFTKNDHDQFKENLIIIDESSMIDISLLSNLLKATPDKTRLVFVGDDNQLPSVGPGNILKEMIDSKLFQTTKLEEIMRQKKDSNIIKLSKMILNKRIDYNIFNEKSEVFFYNADAKEVLDKIDLFFEAFIKKGGDFKKDLQVLVPMYSGVCGIDAINKLIQEKYNHNPYFLVHNNKAYKIGDKVLQLKNEPSLGIMNGDDGIIIGHEKTEEEEVIHIDFNGHKVRYKVSDLDNITLGYAISIHKSQGMEFENVIIPIVPAFYIMLKPKLIYTGFTRAKKKLIIIGKTQSLNQALYSADENRQTSLFLDKNSSIFEINDPEIPFDTLGEENMENVSPYDFMD